MKKNTNDRTGCIVEKRFAAIAFFLFAFAVFSFFGVYEVFADSGWKSAGGTLLFSDMEGQRDTAGEDDGIPVFAEEGRSDVDETFDEYRLVTPIQGYPSAIAHGGGFIEGYTVTNSADAVKASIENGFSFIELDMSFTADGKIAMIHDWASSVQYYLGQKEDDPISYETYLDCKIMDRFQVLTMDLLEEILEENPQVRIVTDTKEDNLRLLTKISREYPNLADRMIPQIYYYEEYEPVRALGYENIILTVYKMSSDLDAGQLADFALQKDLYAVTMSYELAGTEAARILKDKGIAVYMHTINSLEEYQHAVSRGAYGIYTDDLLPEEIGTVKSLYYLEKTGQMYTGNRLDIQLQSMPLLLRMKGPEEEKGSVSYLSEGQTIGEGRLNETIQADIGSLDTGVHEMKANVYDSSGTLLTSRTYFFRNDGTSVLLVGSQYAYLLEELPSVNDFEEKKKGFSDKVQAVLEDALVARVGSPVYYYEGKSYLYLNGCSLLSPVLDEAGHVLIPLYDSATLLGADEVQMTSGKAMQIQVGQKMYTAPIDDVSSWVDYNTTVLKANLMLYRNKAMAGGNLYRAIFGGTYLENETVLVILPGGGSLPEHIEKSVLAAAQQLYQS